MLEVDGDLYVTVAEIRARYPDVSAGLISTWVRAGKLAPVGRDGRYGNIYRWVDVARVETQTRLTRRQRGGRPRSLTTDRTNPNIQGQMPAVDPAREQARARCIIPQGDGTQCPGAAAKHAPFDACLGHLRAAHNYIDAYAARVWTNPEAAVSGNVDRADTDVVYYIRFGNRVKIGTTSDFRRRLHGLPVDEVLAVEPGGRDLEKLRHKQFDPAKVARLRGGKGEWFHLTEDLASHCAMLREHYGTDLCVAA